MEGWRHAYTYENIPSYTHTQTNNSTSVFMHTHAHREWDLHRWLMFIKAKQCVCLCAFFVVYWSTFSSSFLCLWTFKHCWQSRAGNKAGDAVSDVWGDTHTHTHKVQFKSLFSYSSKWPILDRDYFNSTLLNRLLNTHERKTLVSPQSI